MEKAFMVILHDKLMNKLSQDAKGFLPQQVQTFSKKLRLELDFVINKD